MIETNYWWNGSADQNDAKVQNYVSCFPTYLALRTIVAT